MRANPEQQELALESLLELCREPSLVLDLLSESPPQIPFLCVFPFFPFFVFTLFWIWKHILFCSSHLFFFCFTFFFKRYTNYDCDVHCSNLFENLCDALCKRVIPEARTLNILNLLAAEVSFLLLPFPFPLLLPLLLLPFSLYFLNLLGSSFIFKLNIKKKEVWWQYFFYFFKSCKIFVLQVFH